MARFLLGASLLVACAPLSASEPAAIEEAAKAVAAERALRAGKSDDPELVEMPADEAIGSWESEREREGGASQDASSSDRVWRSGTWEIVQGEHDCSLLSADGLIVRYDSFLRKTELVAHNPSISSLAPGESRWLRFAWISSGRLPSLWKGRALFKASLHDGGTFLTAKTLHPDFLQDFARYDNFGLLTDADVPVVRVRLTGSASALSRLKECSRNRAAVSPSDPFAR